MTTEQALALLVHSRNARQRWRAGTLALPADVAADLATTDPDAIERSAALLRRHILERAHAGIGTLATAFPRAITAWRHRHPTDVDLDDLIATFLDAEPATRWRESPGHAPGLSFEEAFYQFARAAELGDPATVEAEWLSIAVRMLALDPEPSYTIPAGFRTDGGVTWALDRGLTLYATSGDRVLIGPVTPAIAQLLRGTSDDVAVVMSQLATPEPAPTR